MNVVEIVVSKKEKIAGKNQYVEQGRVNITVPTLADILPFVTSAISTDKDGKPVSEDGLPVYEADEANWVQAAILSYVKADARNKLIPQTAEVKPGLKIPTNWEELCAEGSRGGNGAALALARDAKLAFAEWAGKQGKSEGTTTMMVTLFSNRAALQLQGEAHKLKMTAYVESFAESLSEADMERFTRPIESVLLACAADTVEEKDF